MCGCFGRPIRFSIFVVMYTVFFGATRFHYVLSRFCSCISGLAIPFVLPPLRSLPDKRYETP